MAITTTKVTRNTPVETRVFHKRLGFARIKAVKNLFDNNKPENPAKGEWDTVYIELETPPEGYHKIISVDVEYLEIAKEQ